MNFFQSCIITIFLVFLSACSHAPLEQKTSAKPKKSSATKDIDLSQLVISDGPFVNINDQELIIKWICNNQAQNRKIAIEQLPYAFSECGLSANLTRTTFENGKVYHSGDYPIAVLSDIHGQHELFMQLIKNNGIVDEQNRWAFGNGRFIITGDIFDRGPKVMETLWFLYDLELQAKQQGGEVLYIIGNHEEMVLNGGLRYLNPKYLKVSEIFNIPYNDLFSEKTLLGQWLRSKPVVIKVNDTVFLHGGLHPELADKKIDLETVNQHFKNAFNKRNQKLELNDDELYWLKTNGPIWYRGYFVKVPDGFEKEIDKLLHFYQLQQITVGHTTAKKIKSHFNGKVFIVDANMKSGKNAEIMFIEDTGIYVGTLDGKRIKLKNR